MTAATLKRTVTATAAVEAKLTYPTELLAKKALLEPLANTEAPADGFCAFCGKPHLKGTAVVSFSPEPTFNDNFNLKSRTSDYLCGSCAATSLKVFQTKYGKALVCEDGIFPCAKNDDIAYWLLNPPAGPWYMHLGTKSRQHITWKTPVNLSQDVFFVQLNSLVLTMRRAALVAQKDAALRLVACVNQARGLKSKSAALRTPYVNPCRELDDPIFGVLRREVLELAVLNPSMQADVQILQAALPGEVWALSATLYATENSVKPAAIDVSADVAAELNPKSKDPVVS